MENKSDWYKNITEEINQHKEKFCKNENKKFKVNLLIRLAKRIDSFSAECNDCQHFRNDINRLTDCISRLPQANKEKRKTYFKSINSIVKHLQKHHKLISDGQNVGAGLGIGMAIGAGIGTSLNNTSIGVSIGMCFGIAIGSGLDAKAKKEGKVI